MKAIDFSFVPRSTISSNQRAIFDQQQALGDEFEDATSYVAKSLKQEAEQRKKAKAQEIQGRIMSEWNAPEGMFKNILQDDEAKARKASSLLAPWDSEMSAKWMDQAERYKNNLQARSDKDTALKQEREALAFKSEMDLKGKELELSAKEKERLAKEEADRLKATREGLELSENDIKTAISARGSGTYEQFWRLKTNNGTNGYAVTLPSPTSSDKEFEEILTSASKGIVAGKLLGSDINKGIADSTVAQLKIAPAKVENIDANKEISEQTSGQGDMKFSKEVAGKIQAIRSKLSSALSKFADWKMSMDKVMAVLPESGSVNDFKAISSIVGFNKIIDPGAVVRESDFDIASSATGKVDNFSSMFERFMQGNTLSETGVRAMKDFINSQIPLYNQAVSHLQKLALQEAERVSGNKATSADIMPYNAVGGTQSQPQTQPQQINAPVIVEEKGWGKK